MNVLIVIGVLAVLYGLYYLANKRYTRRAPSYGERRHQTTFYSGHGGGEGGAGGDGGGGG